MIHTKLLSRQNKFFHLYFLSLLLCFSPFKSLSLITPIFLIFMMIFYVTVRQGYNFLRIVLYIIACLGIGLFYFVINKDFLWKNFFFFFITTSPFLLLILSFKELISTHLLKRMTNITIKILLFEAVFGITQVLYNVIFVTHVFDGGTGDAAMGTVNPTFGSGDGTGSNVYYAIALSALSVLVITFRMYTKHKLRIWALFILVFGWLVASVMHSIFLLLAAILFNSLIIIFLIPKRKITFLNKQFKVIRYSIGIILFVLISLFVFMPNNIDLLKSYYNHTFVSKKSRSTKATATIITYSELKKEKPFQCYIGLGPGQYCSKASMILSDTYLGAKIPSFMKSVSPDLKKYILPIWLEYKSRSWKAGSTYFPFFSWLSLYGELGVVGCIVLGMVMLFFYMQLFRKVNQENFILVFGLLILVFYIFLLGVQDNYWEWAQFMLPIIILAKSIYYQILKKDRVDL